MMEILNAFLDIQTSEQASKLLATLSPHEIQILFEAFKKEPKKYEHVIPLFLNALPAMVILKHYKTHTQFFRDYAKTQALKERLQEIVHQFSAELHELNQKIEALEKQFQISPETHDFKAKAEIQNELKGLETEIHGLIELVWLTEFPELIEIFSNAKETVVHLQNYIKNYLPSPKTKDE